jgi:hypothetical protein
MKPVNIALLAVVVVLCGVILCLIESPSVRAQIAKATGQAPSVPADLRSSWWRANAEALAAEKAMYTWQGKRDQIGGKIREICGKFPVVPDANGEPSCGVK